MDDIADLREEAAALRARIDGLEAGVASDLRARVEVLEDAVTKMMQPPLPPPDPVEPPPPVDNGTPPVDSTPMLRTGKPDKRFDAADLSSDWIDTANRWIRANNGLKGSHQLLVLPHEDKMSLKNASVKPTFSADGAIRVSYPEIGVVKWDPTLLSSPPDLPRFPETLNPNAPSWLDAAHQNIRFMHNADTPYTVEYGDEFEAAIRFMVPVPDGDASYWGQPDNWWILFQATSRTNPTCEGVRISIAHYAYERRIQIFSSRNIGTKKVVDDKSSAGVPWEHNRWYTVRVLCVVDNTENRGWARGYVNGSDTPFVVSNSVRSGHSSGGNMTPNFGGYHAYDKKGSPVVLIDRVEVRKTGRRWPAAPREEES